MTGKVVWRWLSRILVVAAICLAGFLIYRTLSRYSLTQIVEAVSAIPAYRLGMAGLFAAASYLCLTGFDALGVRYADGKLPYHKTALASFTALSLGHNIGLAALSSGAIRYRFYNRWGLRAEQVAKVILFCATTVAIGLMVLAAGALLLRPDLASEMTGLSKPACLAVGGICLVLPAAYIALAARGLGTVRMRSWSFELPSLKLALGQLLVGPVNFAFVAACLHQTLAAVAETGYFAVVSVYVIANVTAIVSHVPGGLGVIESVVMYLIPQADLIGALIAFRFVYFFAPLGLGLILLAATETLFRTSGAKVQRPA